MEGEDLSRAVQFPLSIDEIVAAVCEAFHVDRRSVLHRHQGRLQRHIFGDTPYIRGQAQHN
jgi:hypothetical protein